MNFSDHAWSILKMQLLNKFDLNIDLIIIKPNITNINKYIRKRISFKLYYIIASEPVSQHSKPLNHLPLKWYSNRFWFQSKRRSCDISMDFFAITAQTFLTIGLFNGTFSITTVVHELQVTWSLFILSLSRHWTRLDGFEATSRNRYGNHVGVWLLFIVDYFRLDCIFLQHIGSHLAIRLILFCLELWLDYIFIGSLLSIQLKRNNLRCQRTFFCWVSH